MSKKFTKISLDELKSLSSLLHSNSFYLYPSSVSICFDASECQIYTDGYCIIGKLIDPFKSVWTINSNERLNSSEIEKILAFVSQIDRNQQTLNLIPESSINLLSLQSSSLEVELENNENYPYIYDVSQTVNLSGHEYSKFRREIKTFLRLYSQDVQIRCYTDPNHIQSMSPVYNDLFHGWVEFGTDGSKNIADELFTFNNFLHLKNFDSFIQPFVIELWHNNKLISFSINDIVHDATAINFFHVSNLNLSGVSYFLFFVLANQLKTMDVKFLNFQEDCGISGLRTFKQYLRPQVVERTYFIKG